MMAMKRAAVLAVLALCISAGAQGKRSILQVPQYQDTGISLQNGANQASQSALPASDNGAVNNGQGQTQTQDQTQATPAATTTPVLPAPQVAGPQVGGQPPAGQPPASQPPASQPPFVNPSPPVSVPSTPPYQAPFVQPPAPAQQPPSYPPVAPPVAPPQPQVPAPAPMNALPVQVPVPIPAPAPAPTAIPPQCGQQPQCQLFVEDMLCCGGTGALTNKQHAVLRLQCTHPVNYYPKCFNVSGPSNTTAYSQFETTVWSNTHSAQVSILNGYKGNVTIDIEKNRVDQELSADCGLFITPCFYQGNLISQVPPVNGLSYTTLPTDDFLAVIDSTETDVDALDSLVYANPMEPATCQQVNVGSLNGTFFNQSWVNYSEGDTYTCNVTALTDALAPAPAPVVDPTPVLPTNVSG